jgi:Protein of unknown function (DUF2911)
MKTTALFIAACVLFISCGDSSSGGEQPTDTLRRQVDTNAMKKPDNRVASYVQVDQSPMDMSYFPVDYPKLKMTKQVTTPPLARVIYSRPYLQGRHIFREVLKYGEPWRLGANEATELELFSPATILGQRIKAGRYILYCIPQPDKWTIVLNSNIDCWGLQQDAASDIAKFDAPVVTTTNNLEFYTMVFEKTATGANLLMAWDNAEVSLPFVF